MRRFLVTGASTPLGAELVARLLQREDTGHVLAMGIEERPPPTEPFVRNPRLTWRRCDLTRERRMRRLLFGMARDLEIDTLVHMAQHRSAAVTGKKAHCLNVEATRLLLSLCERHPTITRFVLRSTGLIYKVEGETPFILGEDHPLNLAPKAPQWLRDRVEADLTACTRCGLIDLEIAVLRLAEILAPYSGSQLYDYLQSRVCLRPLGFDPILNLTSLGDAAEALDLAANADIIGVYNVPALDVLPLSTVVRRWERVDIPMPATLLAPLYKLRAATLGAEFLYALNDWRFHFGGVLDGSRFTDAVGFTPSRPIDWPCEVA